MVIFAETVFPYPGTTIKFVDEYGNIIMINRSKRIAYAHHERRKSPFKYLPFSYDLYKITISNSTFGTAADADAIARLPRAGDIEICYDNVTDEFQERMYTLQDHSHLQNVYRVGSLAVDGPL